jgi:hypothetical protein
MGICCIFEAIMQEGRINKRLVYRKLNSYVYLTNVFIRPNVTVSLCRAASALRPSGMTYISLFYVVNLNISDYANMLMRPLAWCPRLGCCKQQMFPINIRSYDHPRTRQARYPMSFIEFRYLLFVILYWRRSSGRAVWGMGLYHL